MRSSDFPAGYAFVSGNANKIAEYASYGFAPPTRDIDLKEADADHATVALQKALDAGSMTVVEDTALAVEGEDFGVNVRWLQEKLPALIGRRVRTMIILAVNDGQSIHLYWGDTYGVIVPSSGKGHGFGYDHVFAPDGFGGLTMSDLTAQGRKGEASARAKALANMLADDHMARHLVEGVTPWTGPWQKG